MKKAVFILCFAMLLTSCGIIAQDVDLTIKDTAVSEVAVTAETIKKKPPVTTVTEPVVTEPELPKLTDEEISAIDNSMVPYGQGRQFNPDNIPLGAINFNEKYGEYGGYAYIPDTDQKREIYLTFDEGYENGFTGKILDTLKEKNAHATFFLTGHYVETQPELIQRMIDEGHLLGNHGDKHKSLPEELLPKSITDAENELLNCHNAVLEKFNYEMHISRPPKGEFSPRSLALTQRLGYKSFLWSFAYADWDPSKQPEPAESLKRITETAHAGEIMLLHPVSSTNCEILGDIIDNLQEQGYTFTTPSV